MICIFNKVKCQSNLPIGRKLEPLTHQDNCWIFVMIMLKFTRHAVRLSIRHTGLHAVLLKVVIAQLITVNWRFQQLIQVLPQFEQIHVNAFFWNCCNSRRNSRKRISAGKAQYTLLECGSRSTSSSCITSSSTPFSISPESSCSAKERSYLCTCCRSI